MDMSATLHGVTLAGAYLGIFSATVVYVPKHAILLRTAATAALVSLAYRFYRQIFLILPYPAQCSNVACFTLICMASSGEILLISRADANDLSRPVGKRKDTQRGKLALLWSAVCLPFNLRRVGTPWQIERLWLRGSRNRSQFLARKFAELVILYLLVDAITVAPRPDLHLVASEKQTLWRFSDLTAEDVSFRLMFTLGYHLMSFISGRFNVTCASFLTVLLGISEPEAWPHFNGPFSACSTMRGFWGTFWHQMSRKTLTGWAELLSDRFLGLRRGTLTSRYTRLFLCFFISGVLHHCIDNALQLSHWTLTGEKFFALQALGIMFEDAVQASTRAYRIPKAVRKVVGFVWVVAFLSWTTPTWAYPALRNDLDIGHLLPFSVITAYQKSKLA